MHQTGRPCLPRLQPLTVSRRSGRHHDVLRSKWALCQPQLILQNPQREGPYTPLKRRPYTPLKHRLCTPLKRRPFTPLKCRPAPPLKRRLLTPLKRRPFTPLKRRPLTPLKRRPFTPLKRRPCTPLKHRPLTPLKRRPFHTPETQAMHTPETQAVHTPETQAIHTPETQAVHTPETQAIHTPETQAVHTPETQAVHTPETQAVHTPETQAVHTPETQAVHTPEMQAVHTPETQAVPTSNAGWTCTPETQARHTPEIHAVHNPETQDGHPPETLAGCTLKTQAGLNLKPQCFGWALVFTPAVAAVSRYFSKRRTLAMGMAFTGVGIGSFVFSPLFQYLIDVYTWRGALLIIAGLMLNLMVCGALIRPLTLREDLVCGEAPGGGGTSCCQGAGAMIFDLLDLTLLRHWPFLTLVLSITLINAGYFVPYVHFVAHARSIGFDEYKAAFLMSVAGVMDLIGRLLSGWFSDLRRMRLVHILILWTSLTGLSLIAIPFGRSYSVLMTISVAYGFCAGALTPVVFSLLPEIVGIGRIYGALGLLQMLESVGGLLGAPISGWLRDATGNYTASFMVAGTFLLLGSLVLLGIPSALSCSRLPPARQPRTEEGEEECKSMAVSNGSGLETQCLPIGPSGALSINAEVA
ncbi:monocarboxylate transporter 3-like [Mustelus asterias]